MLDYDYAVIGGGIAGTSAAETIRRGDGQAKIAILEAEPYLLYSRVLLPDFVKGEADLKKVMLRKIQDYEKNRIDFYPDTVVSKIDFERNEIFADARKFSYKKLLIASGGRVKPWDFEARFPDKVYRLQTLDDAERLKELLEQRKPRQALVVGGGFIAVEFLNIFKHYGVSTTLLTRDPYFWSNFLDEHGSTFLRNILDENNIKLVTSNEIQEISERGGAMNIKTSEGETLNADALAAGIGLERNFGLVRDVLETGRGIFVDEFFRAKFVAGGAGNVWAVGDVAEYLEPFSGERRVFGNWTHGFLTGHNAGLNMTGGAKPFRSVASYSISLLGLPAAVIGAVGGGSDGETFSVSDGAEKKYGRFFMRAGKLVGAVLIGAQKDTPRVIKMIESGERLEKRTFRFS